MAMGAYDAIKERGLRHPRDIAVIGFDNQELIAAYLRPKLTTVALPFEKMGALGVQTLAALTAGQPITATSSWSTVRCSNALRSDREIKPRRANPSHPFTLLMKRGKRYPS